MGTVNNSVFDGPVVIVGGGVTGLTTAHLLAEAGVEVVVIEREPEVGGLAGSFQYDEFVFDIGPHRFHTANPNVDAYVERLLERHATYFPRKSEVYFKGSYYRWPLHPRNLLQLPVDLAGKSFMDLSVNGLKTYGNDSFEDYVLKQYGPTLYEHFFRGYSEKFLGIHPQETHPDWAKVGINRAIIDDKLEMQNLSQLLKSTLLQFNKTEIDFTYPKGGMHEAWTKSAQLIRALGGRIITGVGARLEGSNGRITAVHAGEECFKPSVVVWTAPITVACRQLELTVPKLDYLGLLLYNVMVNEDCPRDFQWCYYGAEELIFNRISTPKFFSPETCPAGTVGYCVELTCMENDTRWHHAERLTDWVIDDLRKVGLISNRQNVIDVRVERVRD
ncbi:MAG: FAD-dependent oxidoreductase, partial [Myxococcota bacterium]|nr:FAD-dependent oxidoreductase [Myxococcota bacterium]